MATPKHKSQAGNAGRRQLWLARANRNLVCDCSCEPGLAGAPEQSDSPWAGTGWQFACTRCRKPFTFAKAVYITRSREELAREDLRGLTDEEPTRGEIREWIEGMRWLLEGLEEGREYVYLDGWMLPVNEGNVKFEGSHAVHEFEVLPQVAALTDPLVLDQTLRNPDYWKQRQVVEEDDAPDGDADEDDEDDDEAPQD